MPATPRSKPAPAETAEPIEQVSLSGAAPSPIPLAATGANCAYQALLGGFTNFSAASLPRIAELRSQHDPDRVTHVLYHKDCLDGITAAWAAWKRLGDKAEYIPVTYQTPVPALPPDARVAVVDFSFLPEQMRELKSKVEDVVVLDHHETAAERLSAPDFGDYVLVDQERAGAGLTWHYFHPTEPLPALVAYAEDRDLWRFDLPMSAEVNKAMASHPYELPTWDKLELDQLKQDGAQIYRFMQQQNDFLATQARVVELAGHRVPVVNSPTNVDELAAVVLEQHPEAPFMACYFDEPGGNLRWELRSRSGFVVNEVAARFGGGGHKEAAGFTVPGPPTLTIGELAPVQLAAEPVREAPAVERFVGQQVQMALATARTADGIPVANSALNVDDVGRALQKQHPQADRVAVYRDRADGSRLWSFFSARGREDFIGRVELLEHRVKVS